MSNESHILKYVNDRSEIFRPNKKLDGLIARLSSLLNPAQQSVIMEFDKPKLPIMAILGCPRSGTTLITQLLANSGEFFYPSNFLSRFAYAPYIGSLIQQMIFDPEYDLRNELGNTRTSSEFLSDIGKTDGALGINEFFHFWRRFFPNHDPGHLTEADLKLVDISGMRRELAAIESVWQRPFMSKAMMLQYNISFFSEHVPEMFFVHIQRDPKFVMQSISQARKKYYGGKEIWWSVKPKEYSFLKDMEFTAQVAGQVFFTEKAITDQLNSVDDSRKLVIKYEELCESPDAFFMQLSKSLNALGVNIDIPKLHDKFLCENRIRIPEHEMASLLNYYDDFKANNQVMQ